MSSYTRNIPETYEHQWSVHGRTMHTQFTYREQVIRPPTVKRIKPIDLFASGTSRAVTRIKTQVLTPHRYWYSYTQSLYGPSYRRDVAYFAPAPGYNNTLSQPYNIYNMPSNDLCDTKTLLEIKNQKVNLGVSIAELGKTTDLVTGFFKDLHSFFRALRLADRRQLIRAVKNQGPLSKDLSSKWLKYQYGAVPLMFEVNGLSEYIYREIKDSYITGIVRHDLGLQPFKRTGPGWPETTETFPTVIRKNTYRYRVDSDKLRSLSQAGITNPALVVWELVPYSFVIDWFLGIGDYLEALDALVGVKDLLVIRGYTERYVRYHSYRSPSGGTHISNGEAFTFYRKDSRNAPVSTLKPQFPTYKPSLSTTRLISASALIRNLFK